MHFHWMALCMNCHTMTRFSTPIASILVLSSMCQHCGWHDLVGWGGDALCQSCRDLWMQDIEKEHAMRLLSDS